MKGCKEVCILMQVLPVSKVFYSVSHAGKDDDPSQLAFRVTGMWKCLEELAKYVLHIAAQSHVNWLRNTFLSSICHNL